MKPRQILTPVSDRTQIWILKQNQIHGTTFNKVLSAARLTRSVLAGLAEADADVGAQPDANAIEKLIAAAFKRHAEETRA